MATNVKVLNETGKFVKSAWQPDFIRLYMRGLWFTTLSILTILPSIPLPACRLLFHRFFWGQFSVLHFLSDYFHFSQMDFILHSFDNQFHILYGCSTVCCSVQFEHLYHFQIGPFQEQGSFCFHFGFHVFNLILHFLFLRSVG